MRLLAPFVPHVAEAVHQAYFRRTEGVPALARAPWPLEKKPAADEDGVTHWPVASGAVSALRKWRSEHKVSPAKPIPKARVTLAPEPFALWGAVEADVRAACRVGAIEAARGGDASGAIAVEVLEPPAS